MLDYLEDLESDFSVFHRVDDMYALPAEQFFALSVRMAAYSGALAARFRQEGERTPAAPQTPTRPTEPGGIPEVPLNQVQAVRDRIRQEQFAKFGQVEHITDDEMMALLRSSGG